jgi:hypothetical protein
MSMSFGSGLEFLPRGEQETRVSPAGGDSGPSLADSGSSGVNRSSAQSVQPI